VKQEMVLRLQPAIRGGDKSRTKLLAATVQSAPRMKTKPKPAYLKPNSGLMLKTIEGEVCIGAFFNQKLFFNASAFK
jgi:hypothetical protein